MKRRTDLPEVDLTPYAGHPQTLHKHDSERISVPPQPPVPPRRGQGGTGSGRSAIPPQVPVQRGSTAEVEGLYPWLHGAALPAEGAYIGVDCVTGDAFCCHPLAWLLRELISNPNVALTGEPGRGKSATIKALILRLLLFGLRALIAGDLKGEYAPLTRAVGAEPVELGPGLPARLNPLDAGPLGKDPPRDPDLLRERLAEIHRRRLVLLAALAAVRLGRDLTPTEETALSLAVREASGGEGPLEGAGAGTGIEGVPGTGPTIPQVHALLRDPTPAMARQMRIRRNSVTVLRDMTRPVTDALGAMIDGALAGLFDGPTTVAPDWNAPIQSIDLSRLASRGDATIAMTMACVSSWAQAAIDEPGPARIVVRDELWRSLRIPALLTKLDSDLRMSRNDGTIQVLATHRLSDFEAAGPAGSAEAAIARGLIASCDTRVVLGQDVKPLEDIRDQVGLTDVECAHIASWSGRQVGRAVWKVGRAHSAVVQLTLTPVERELFYTSAKMEV